MKIENTQQLAAEITTQQQAIALLHTEIAQLQKHRSEKLLAGDMKGTDQAETAIAEKQRQASRLEERVELLQRQREGLAEGEAQSAAETRHARALEAQRAGITLVEQYRKLAPELAVLLRRLAAVDAFIDDVNRQNDGRRPTVTSVTTLQRSSPTQQHEEIECYWVYPSRHPGLAGHPVRSVGGTAIPPRPEPADTGEYHAVTGYPIKEAPELRKRSVIVVDAPARYLDAIAEVAHLPGAGLDDAALWDRESFTASGDECIAIVDEILASGLPEPTKLVKVAAKVEAAK